MEMTVEPVISVAAALAALLLLVFTVDWRHFRDWVVVFLYKCVLDSLWGTAAVVTNRIEFPYRPISTNFSSGDRPLNIIPCSSSIGLNLLLTS